MAKYGYYYGAGGSGGGAPSGLLFDDISGGLWGYSKNRMRNSYAGDALELRETGGDTLLDVGFNTNDFDNASAETHRSTNRNRIRTFYEQVGGSASDISQTTNANQPELIPTGLIRGDEPTANQYMTGTGVSLTGDFTIGFWYRSATNNTDRQTVIDLGNGGSGATGNNITFNFNNDGGGFPGLQVYMCGGGSDDMTAGSSGDYTDGLWHFIMLTRSGTDWELWIDNTMEDSRTFGAFTVNANITLFSREVSAPILEANGYVHGLACFNKAVSAGERGTFYNFDQPTEVYDFDTLSVIARMDAIPVDARKTVINTLVAGIKTDEVINNLFDRFDGLWILAAHAQQASQPNWAKDTHFIAEVNSPTWTLDRGYTGNSTDMYLDTNFSPGNDGVNFAQDDASLGIYNRTAGNDAGAEIGSADGANNGATILIRFTDNNRYYRVNHGGGANSVGSIDPQGLASIERTGAAAIEAFANGVSIDTDTDSSSALQGNNIYILAVNANGTPSNHSGRQVSFAFVASSSVNHLNLTTRIEAYLDALGAGVIP